MNQTFLSMRLAQAGLLAFALASVGCNCGCENSSKPEPAPSTESAASDEATAAETIPPCCQVAVAEKTETPVLPAAEEASWGTVKGQAVFAGGAAPVAGPITVTKDVGHCLSKGPILNEEWVVNPKNKGVRWTYVWLDPGVDPVNKGKLPIHPALMAPKTPTVEMDQPCCKFEPHVLAMRADQQLIFKNSSPIPHNVNYTGGLKNPGDNKLLAPDSKIVVELKASPTPVVVACNIHSWMKAWVRVYDHPYFVITDENGNFEIKNAPAGKFRLIAWHESVGWLLGEGGKPGKTGIPIEIKPNETTEVKVDVKPSE